MARRWRMCVVEGCERRARVNQMTCRDHAGTAVGLSIQREVVRLEREVRTLMLAESAEERTAAAKRFQQRVERGDFATLFSGRFRELLQQGAAEPLDTELGALRLALVRLMTEEQDPTRMATALSKVVNATARVFRTKEKLAQGEEGVMGPVREAWKAVDEERERLDAFWQEADARQEQARADLEAAKRYERWLLGQKSALPAGEAATDEEAGEWEERVARGR